eukprot:4447351-Lingulodinium_polyedra.AAC.1
MPSRGPRVPGRRGSFSPGRLGWSCSTGGAASAAPMVQGLPASWGAKGLRGGDCSMCRWPC